MHNLINLIPSWVHKQLHSQNTVLLAVSLKDKYIMLSSQSQWPVLLVFAQSAVLLNPALHSLVRQTGCLPIGTNKLFSWYANKS